MIDPVRLAEDAGIRLTPEQVSWLTALHAGAEVTCSTPRAGRYTIEALAAAASIADGEPVRIMGTDAEGVRRRALKILDQRDRALS